MIGVIVKTALLVHFLVSIKEASGQSPCPNYFWYSRDDGTNEIVGFVEVPPPPRGVTLDLSVSLSIAVALPSKYVGRLELAQSKEDSVRAVNLGRPLRYKIHFPLPQPIPVLTGIRFNGQFMCSGPRASGQIVTSIVLNHTLYPPGVLPLSQDQGNVILINPDYNIPIRDDVSYPIGPKPQNDYYPRPSFNNYSPAVQPTYENYPRPSVEIQPFDNNPRPTFDNNPRPTFDNNPRPTFDNNPRPTFDNNARPTFDNNPRPTFDNNARPTFDNNARPTFDNNARPTFDNNARPTFNNNARPTFDNNLRPTFDNNLRPTFDNNARPTFDNNPRPPSFDNNPRPPSFDNNPRPPSFDNNARPPSFDSNPRPPSFDNYPRPTPSPKPTTTMPAPRPVNRPEDNNADCGRSEVEGINPLVAKGTKTSHGQWPWLAALFIVKPAYEFQCGGMLVTNNHVITAAHCFQLNNMDLPKGVLAVSLGRHRLRNFLEEGSRNMEVAEYRIHPDYDASGNADADLGVIVLRERVEYSRWIKPICLWSGPTELERVVGKTGYVVGWGRDEKGNPHLEEPRMTKSPIVSYAVCFWSNANFVSLTSNRTFCAGLRDGSGPCNGDSGSGFVLYDNRERRYYLRGIVSGSLLDSKTMSCDLSQYIVYVDVAKHLDWIRKQIYT